MSGLVYALALFGCSDDATMCERLSDKALSFESRVACEMQTAAVLNSDLSMKADYPTVIAQCMSQAQWTRLDGKPVDLSRGDVRMAANDPRPRS